MYDVSNVKDGLGQMNTPAYALPHMDVGGSGSVGHTFIRHPVDAGDKGLIFMRLSQRGSIHRLDLHIPDDNDQVAGDMRTHIWSEEVEKLDKDMERSGHDLGLLSERTFSVVDLEPAYHRELTLCLLVWPTDRLY